MQLTDPLFIFFVVLISAQILGFLAKRVGQPVLVGQVLAGVLLGPMFLGLVEYSEFISFLARIGIFFLMFITGLEMQVKKLEKNMKTAFLTAIGGVVLPFLFGFLVGRHFGLSSIVSSFLGAALSITAVGVSADILLELKKFGTKIGQTIIGAAIIDDIFGIMVLSVIVGVVQAGISVSFLKGLFTIFFEIGGFFLFVAVFGYLLIPLIRKYTHFLKDREAMFTIALIFLAIFGLGASFVGLQGVIGAFFAGLLLNYAIENERAEQLLFKEFKYIAFGIFTPFFFFIIGVMFDFKTLIAFPLFAFMVLCAAVSGKILGGAIGSRIGHDSWKESVAIGVGMNFRGAVELVVLEIGRQAGIIPESIFSVIVAIALITTVITPPLLKKLL